MSISNDRHYPGNVLTCSRRSKNADKPEEALSLGKGMRKSPETGVLPSSGRTNKARPCGNVQHHQSCHFETLTRSRKERVDQLRGSRGADWAVTWVHSLREASGNTYLIRGIFCIRLCCSCPAGEVSSSNVAEVDLSLGRRPTARLPSDNDGTS